MKSKFQTQLGDSVELELKGTTTVMLVGGIAALPCNVDEVEILRDEFERYARAMRGKDADPPSIRLTYEELMDVVLRLDGAMLADGVRPPALESAFDKFAAAYRIARRSREP